MCGLAQWHCVYGYLILVASLEVIYEQIFNDFIRLPLICSCSDRPLTLLAAFQIDDVMVSQFHGQTYTSMPTWSRYMSPEGVPYYYNASTGVTTWERPKDYIEPAPAPAPPQKQQKASTKRGAKQDVTVGEDGKVCCVSVYDHRDDFIFMR